MLIIPAINCHHKDFDCVSGKVKLAEKFADWIHLDIADARFTYNRTWNEAERWPSLKTKLKLEVHLMVEEPEKIAEEWLRAGARRLIVHVEAVNEKTLGGISAAAGKYGAELMLASNPDTAAENFRSYFGKISEFQVLAVHPGLAGQKFLPAVLNKIKFLRRESSDAKIEVDGGMDAETARLAKEAGADIIVSASCIFDNPNPQTAYKKLAEI